MSELDQLFPTAASNMISVWGFLSFICTLFLPFCTPPMKLLGCHHHSSSYNEQTISFRLFLPYCSIMTNTEVFWEPPSLYFWFIWNKLSKNGFLKSILALWTERPWRVCVPTFFIPRLSILNSDRSNLNFDIWATLNETLKFHLKQF